MKILLASDHAGYDLKRDLIAELSSRPDVEVTDLGPDSADSVDYPDYAHLLSRRFLQGGFDSAILICNSGIGMSMAANRHRGIRAALCLFPAMAWWARHHNNANVLVLGGGFTAPFLAMEIVDVFLREPFDGGRHERRTEKLDRCGGTE